MEYAGDEAAQAGIYINKRDIIKDKFAGYDIRSQILNFPRLWTPLQWIREDILY